MATYQQRPGESWEDFQRRVSEGFAAHLAEQGQAEAREIFAESPAELRELADGWRQRVADKDCPDRPKVVAFIAEADTLLAGK
jgi:hypothetical protein